MDSSASSISGTDSAKYTIEELYAKKSRLIEALKFEKAEIIEQMIQEKKLKDDSIHFEEAKIRIVEVVQNIYQIYCENIKNIKENEADEELKEREKADISFAEIRDRHIEELTVIEKEFALEVYREKQRPVKAQLDTITLAKNMAKVNDFAGAVKTRDKAYQLFEQEHIIRRAALDKKYEVIKAQVFEKQRNELLILNQRLRENLTSLQIALKNDLNSQLKLFRVSIRAEHQRIIGDLLKKVKSNEEKRRMSDVLNQLMINQVYQISGIEIDSSIPPSSAARASQTSAGSSPTKRVRQKTEKLDDNQNKENEEEDESEYVNNLPSPDDNKAEQDKTNDLTHITDGNHDDNENKNENENEIITIPINGNDNNAIASNDAINQSTIGHNEQVVFDASSNNILNNKIDTEEMEDEDDLLKMIF
ncbi:hypothetical protein TRFO_42552 [Tritrichomonas foetus]|uniref:Uncharacterized protein n=1 Tax=Tritrichomonas foetus TaxID=1144522 RepID=A0A1J4KVV0_9EUKA|nr:hypothetical protein TRFO_42552 [Tritrichomonas foetus]|eukprot:OHT15355.1 hypothetical protein TRFO_42552 [Tritrichomonas foetus]